ncbi:hypothetical protein [Mycolicibacterium sarraceniae]|uniref:Transmembrane protein n=1 Tax=Mycolicibacterium sarraceniae TaxID=1534348 RepID=A0A7I7SQF3_9MYCO|nr:hypothetical protein [Mycolicibacterium sarraceniae]BBY59224.1 hypothetical protein MSAR_23600 [Mycolicibacterium sarraceniae]
MHYFEALAKVLVVGLVLGAGLPAIFASGMVAYSFGAGGEEADGVVHKGNPALKYLGIALFLFVTLVILTAVAWITRTTIIHHFGIDLFPGISK